MQIRSQYLIQDNHNDYTSGPLPSHGPPRYLPPLVYTRVRIPTDTYLLSSFLRDARLSFSPSPSPSPPPPPCLCAIVYAWKLEVPRCPAAARGVSWQKCNAAYHKICPRCSLRGRGRSVRYTRMYSAVWKCFAREIGERISAGGNLNEF